MKRKALVMGFFSTVGDIECLKIICRWLDRLGIPSDVAPYSKSLLDVIPGARDPREVDGKAYSHLVIVCGPCWKTHFKDKKIELGKFRHCVRIGVNLTMIDPVEDWNPFDILIERDSDRTNRPDMTFLEATPQVSVVGRCLTNQQKEYGQRQRHAQANQLIEDLIERRNLAVVDIDTRWPDSRNSGGLKDASQLVSVMKRVDVLLTTRLHGLVFALKSGVPVIALDAIQGGDKVISQAGTIGWPMAMLAEDASDKWMDAALDWCLSPEARSTIGICMERILPALRSIEHEFNSAMTADITPSPLPQDPDSPPSGRWFSRLLRP